MVAKVKDETAASSFSSSTIHPELKKGPWKPEEDMLLIEYVKKHGERDWNMVRKNSGLARCGKSCRLRWNNHLRPNLRKGPFSPDEEKLICQLHSKIGNKWARIAAMLPGRTDNEIKNFWNTRVKRLTRKGVPLYPPDIQCPRPEQLNPYLQHMDGQNNTSSLSSPPPTSSSATLHSLLFPPPTASPSHSQQPPQFSQYDVVLQNSMALYDAALENSRQQHQQQMLATAMMNNKNDEMTSSFHGYKRHRSVPNLTISVPPVRQVALHPFSPIGISSPLGQSVSMASTPTTSYMQVTPMSSPHSYTSSPTSRMVVSPTALQLGIPMSSQPCSFRLPPLSYSPPPVMETRPTCLPRTTSFSFDHMLFNLNAGVVTQEQINNNQMQAQAQAQAIADNNRLTFSVEDLGISMGPDQHNQISNDDIAPGALDDFLKDHEEEIMKYEDAAEYFTTEQAKAFLNELDTMDESRFNCSSSGGAEAEQTMQQQQLELEAYDDDQLLNLLDSNELIMWDNNNENKNSNVDGQSQEASQLNTYKDVDGHMGMKMEMTSSSGWDILPGVY